MNRNSKSKASMKQVAEMANVSLQTVSRVVNKQPGVSSETRAQINQIIDDIGYRPNRAAQAMRGSSYTLGVVGFGLQYYGPSHILMGVDYEASEQNYRVILKLLRNPHDFDLDGVLEEMLADHVDGIVWGVPQIGSSNPALLAKAQSLPVPVVFTDSYSDRCKMVVRADNYGGARLATRHLIEQGHQKICIITGPLDYASAAERLRSWRDTLHEAGLPHDDSLVYFGDWSARSGAEGFKSLYQQHPDMTAVFASNDYMALGVLYSASALHVSVPEQIAVVGYDDIPEAEFFQPALTSVGQNLVDIGIHAVRELIDAIEMQRIEGHFDHHQRTFKPELIVRASSVKALR